MKIQDVMSRNVYPVGQNDFIDDAVSSMAAHHVTASPVLDRHDQVVGMVTATHLQVAWMEHHLHPMRAFFAPIWRRSPVTVGAVMQTPVTSVSSAADISCAAKLFADSDVECILVIDDLHVSGIIWPAYLMR